MPLPGPTPAPGLLPALRTLHALHERAVDAVELMDAPDCDPEMLRRTYAQFRYINAAVSGWRGIYRRSIRPRLSTTRPSTLLDVGCGGGDLARSLASWAARDGLRLAVTGIDPDERALDFARALPPLPLPGGADRVRFRSALSSELADAGDRFDFVVSNHVLHHLSGTELGGLLKDSEQLCSGLVVHADIERARLAYVGFALGTLPFFHRSFIRADGLTSIRRSFTAPELRAVAPPGWWVERGQPSRLELRWRPGIDSRAGVHTEAPRA